MQSTLHGNTVGSLTSIQHAVLVGSLLGDGTLRRQGERKNALFEVNHAIQARAYVDWKYQIFQEMVLTAPKQRKGNGNRVAYRFTTRSLPVLTNYYLWFYQNGKKQIPSNLTLEPLSLAVWFMDDGNKSRTSCYLNTQQFSQQEQEFLQGLLKKTFGLESHLNRDKQYTRLRITTQSSSLLKEIIGNWVIPENQYKLSDDPVTTDLKREASE